MSDQPRSPPSKSWADDSDESGDEADFNAIPESVSQRNLKVVAGEGGGDGEGSKDKGDLEKSAASKTSETDQPVASLLSRISGLSTSNTPSDASTSASSPSVPSPQPPTASPSRSRPQAQVANNLFGRALAGVKSDRAPAASPAPPSAASAPSSQASTSASASTKPPAAPSSTTTAEGGSSSKGKELLPDTSDKKEGMTLNIMDESTGNGGGPAETVETEMRSEGGATGLISNDFQVEVQLADQQADAASPLYSIKTFEQLDLHPDLQKGIYGVGFKKPSKIQERALPLLLNNPPRNLIGQSQSGTGKTAAFALNMLSRIAVDMQTPQAICLAPSRELARQIQKVVDEIGKFTNITTFLAVPQSWSRNQKITKHILIGTPGTLVDMLSRGNRIFDPTQIRMLVLDEADEMVALQGLGDQTSRIKRMLPAGTQNILFSATFPEEVREFASVFAPEANQIYLKKEDVTVAAITQLYLECDGEDTKYGALSSLYDVMTIGQSIVFCKRRATADDIAERLTSEGHAVASLHGEKQSGERDDILDGFRNGKTKVLITTNVIARGIDIQQVNMVVNYDVPDLGPDGDFRPDVETYIHRIGRTGRFGRKGCAVTFAHDGRSKNDVEYIMQETGRPMKKIDVTRSTDMEQLEKALKAAMKGA